MKKHILASSVIVLLTFSTTASADWKETLNQGLDKAKSYLKSDKIKPEPSHEMSATQDSLQKNWNKVEEKFDEILELKDEKSDAKDSWLFGDGKAKIQKEIDDVMRKVLEILTDEDLENLQDDLQSNAQSRASVLEDISKVKSELRRTFDQDDTKDLQEDITKLEQKLAKVDANRSEIIHEVRVRLGDFGQQVTDSEVEALLTKVNADDILSMTTVFPVISEFATYLGRVAQDTDEDLAMARKYYGMYVLLLEFQMHIQNTYADKIEYVYKPKLANLRKESKNLISKTRKLAKKSNGSSKEIYKNNLENQKFTLKAIELYDTFLSTDLRKIKNANKLVSKSYEVALNTYKTVDLSFNVSSLINSNSELFEEVMSLQTPELIPFENKKMKEEFEKLTSKMNDIKTK